MCVRAGFGFDSSCDQFIQSNEVQMAAMKEFGYVHLISCVQISTWPPTAVVIQHCYGVTKFATCLQCKVCPHCQFYLQIRDLRYY
jgi:hypothetical protein